MIDGSPRRNRPRAAICSVLFLVSALMSLQAATAADPVSHPGFVDGSFLKEFAASDGELVEVTLDSNLLRMFAAPARSIDEGIGNIASRLASLRALVIELRDDAGAPALARVDEIRDRLERSGWQQIARVQDGNERVNVMLRMSGDVIQGITVLVLDENELVFTNIAGELRPEDLEQLTQRFSVPGMESFADHAHGSDGHDHDDDDE